MFTGDLEGRLEGWRKFIGLDLDELKVLHDLGFEVRT